MTLHYITYLYQLPYFSNYDVTSKQIYRLNALRHSETGQLPKGVIISQ